MRKDVTQGFDEVAHASYVAHLQRTGDIWPAFADLRMLDPSTFRFTDEANYLNHPSPYYLLLARLGPGLEGHPAGMLVYRLFNVALAAIGLAALMAIGVLAKLPRLPFYALVVPIACIPVMAPLAGAINNDNAAFAGGSIATLAAFRLLANGSRSWLFAALGGVILASWAKFTGLVLAGGLVAGALLWLVWRGRLPFQWIVPIAIAMLLAGVPYVALLAQYGSPAPTTPGVMAMIKTGALTMGWDSAPRMTPVSFFMHFVSEFVAEWMPALRERSALNYAALAIPIAAGLCALGGIWVAGVRIVRGTEGPLEIVVVAGALAFAVTLLLHIIFGYRLHTEFGWMTTAYPRYYLPLAGVVPLAGLSLLGAIRQSTIRTLLLAFLIGGPVAFRLLGAPLG
ncbi:hypothetical protein [Bradyrhizobium sp. LMTR 3]|uniref:hypothetical protein n=1 Tax=Bradyrhizobium sp. LMTR 3 TaxID=189873 RepID=UPI001147221B|nr:hypothetical protein [Bradyrhizobium sp. LMTR 3]